MLFATFHAIPIKWKILFGHLLENNKSPIINWFDNWKSWCGHNIQFGQWEITVPVTLQGFQCLRYLSIKALNPQYTQHHYLIWAIVTISWLVNLPSNLHGNQDEHKRKSSVELTYLLRYFGSSETAIWWNPRRMLTFFPFFGNGRWHNWFDLDWNLIKYRSTTICVLIFSTICMNEPFLGGFNFSVEQCCIIRWSWDAHCEWNLKCRLIKAWKDFPCKIWTILCCEICPDSYEWNKL